MTAKAAWLSHENDTLRAQARRMSSEYKEITEEVAYLQRELERARAALREALVMLPPGSTALVAAKAALEES